MTAAEILNITGHRPFSLPRRPWVMRQEWHDLAFFHWRVNADALRTLVPRQLELDLWKGEAYVAITPMVIRRLRPRCLPALPGVSVFPELNFRTYVRLAGIGGVFFFSLDAANASAVLGARIFYGLPYYRAAMTAGVAPARYESRRIAAPGPAVFIARYGPSSGPLEWRPPAESLERFLTERYCLYAFDGHGLYRTHIHHIPWSLQAATVDIEQNSIAAPVGIQLSGLPELAHFSRSLDVLVWWPERVG